MQRNSNKTSALDVFNIGASKATQAFSATKEFVTAPFQEDATAYTSNRNAACAFATVLMFELYHGNFADIAVTSLAGLYCASAAVRQLGVAESKKRAMNTASNIWSFFTTVDNAKAAEAASTQPELTEQTENKKTM